MKKTHFSVDPANSLDVACGRNVNDFGQTPFVERVTCQSCKGKGEYNRALRDHLLLKEQRFLAQAPREYREPWNDGNIACRECSGVLFRIGDRTCYGHYENYHCDECGHVESRMTERGMSF